MMITTSTARSVSDPATAARLTTPVPGKTWPGWGWLGLGVVMMASAVFLYSQFTPAISEPDDNGYFAQGSLLARSGQTWFRPESDAQYLGMHWLLAPDGRYVCRYPPGLAVVIGALYAMGGWQACLWINPALALLTLLGFFLLARRLVPAGWALAGVAVLAANPTFMYHALTGDAHVGVACLLAWGVYLLVRWGEEGRLWQAFAAGVVLGCIPAIRCGDAVLGVGVAVYLLWHWRRFPRIGWHYLAAVAGAAVAILPLLVHNQRLFGAFWRTGYSLTHEGTGFGWSYFQAHAVSYIRQLSGNGIGLFFALGFIGMLCMLSRRGRRETQGQGLMLLVMASAMLVVYMAYYWAPQMNASMTLRFLLPTYLAYVLAGCWLLGDVSAAMSARAQVVLGMAVVAFQMLWGGSELWSQATQLHYQKETLARVTLAVEKTAQPGDMIVGSGNVLQQLDFVRQWKIADESFIKGNGGGGMGPGGAGGPPGFGGQRNDDTPSPSQAAKVVALQRNYTGSSDEKKKKFAADVAAWAGVGHKVYVVGTEATVKAWDGLAGGSIRVVERVALPARPQVSLTGVMGGGAGGPPPGFGGGMGGLPPPGGDGMGGPPGGGGGGGGGMMPPPNDGLAGALPGGGDGQPPPVADSVGGSNREAAGSSARNMPGEKRRRSFMRGGMPGGFGGPMGGFEGESEVVIAEFIPHAT